MAKRRKLEAPSAADMTKLEEEFRGETSSTSPLAPLAPIAQVAADAATQNPVQSAETRAALAQAEQFRDKDGKGLVLSEIPLEHINPIEIFRDRTVLEKEDLDELKFSIARNGQRLPIEVFPITQREGSRYKYGLISGYRRLLALEQLCALHEGEKFGTVKAIVRTMDSTQDSLAAMIEENEVRADVSHYERGRVAALAAQSDYFANLDEAVAKLYPVASKAKRSKIRSFALIFEELGDLLEFPEFMTEKQGLKVSSALRDGAERALREALGAAVPENAADEWAALEEALTALQPADPKVTKSRGGRPRKAKTLGRSRTTRAGFEVSWGEDQGAYVIRVAGANMSRQILNDLADNVAYLLDKAD